MPTAMAGAMVPTVAVPTAMAAAMVPTVAVLTAVVPTAMADMAVVATAAAPTAVVPTIKADTAVQALKWCLLDDRLAVAAPVMTYHHGRRDHMMVPTVELSSSQPTEETVPPLQLRTGVTRMKSISVVLFPPLSAARNRVLGPLLVFCSFPPRSRVFCPTSCPPFSRRSVLAPQP